jgi:hypothetical protein
MLNFAMTKEVAMPISGMIVQTGHSEPAVPSHMACLNERRLRDEQNHPGKEGRRM